MAAGSPVVPPSSSARFRRRILVALAVGPVAAAVFALIYGLSPDLWPMALVIISPIGIGLLSGMGARLAFPGRRVLAWMIATSSSCLALLLLGWLTAGSMGLNPSALPAPTPAWGGLFEVAMSIGGAWLTTHAWSAATGAAEPPLPPPTPAPVSGPAPTQTQAERIRPFQLGRAFERWRRGLRRHREQVRLPDVQPREPRRSRRRLGVRIGRLAEERCPYCLDQVRPGDPRGVRRCEVCHTAHHADCWAQTGTCQVLHHHA